MKTNDFNYELPEELIAQKPSDVRSLSKLLIVNRSAGTLTDASFEDITGYIQSGDCMVINDTKVLCARFFARRKTGASLEGLYLEQNSNGLWNIMLKGARKVKVSEEVILEDKQQKEFCNAVVVEKYEDGKCLLEVLSDNSAEQILEQIGYPPLPPYIKRGRDIEQAQIDKSRYQTVYAENYGAVAAPTAGLHFTKPLIEKLRNKGVIFANVTLHVGAGTFKPVTAENLEDHKIHSEKIIIDEHNAKIINDAKSGGGRIIAVGTTSVRSLETSASEGKVTPYNGSTELFIMPGYKYKVVDAMVTNFHLPKSTLLALVSAFASRETILNAYRHAASKRYRFFSYGDSMLIL